MTNQELYKQAILDAKAVRETAMAAAKESLAEAFEPRIKEMLRLKLSEEMEKTDTEESVDMEETYDQGDTPPFKNNSGTEKGAPYGKGSKNEPGHHAYQIKVKETSGSLSEDELEESTLEEILAELDELSGDDSNMKETKMDKMEEAKDDEAGEDAKEDDEDAKEAPKMGEEASDDEQVVELTVGELKDIFRDVFAQAQGGATPEMGGTLDEPTDKPEELSLEEILAELEEEENKMEEAINPGVEMAHKKTPGKYGGGEYKVDEAKMKMEKDLEEANKAVKAMREELQEVNLLNAKLLYVNKIWKGKSLSESQKVKVLNAFDRATTVKEAENIFKTLNESLVAPKKTDLKESMGFASKPIGSAPAKPIVEIDSMVARWQTIAGIK